MEANKLRCLNLNTKMWVKHLKLAQGITWLTKVEATEMVCMNSDLLTKAVKFIQNSQA